MKKYAAALIALINVTIAANPQEYPEPEFSNEIYFLKKDSVYSLVRLEKENASMEMKTKAAGFGGYENGYILEGEKSSVRLTKGPGLSFIFTNTAGGGQASSAEQDSILRANGIDPSMMNASAGTMSAMNDPVKTITLYKTDVAKGKRKVLMQKAPGAFGGKKLQSSDKYTFSIKKIKDGYWELVIDKNLPAGEYAFTMLNMGLGSMDGSSTIYCFGID
ncbi:MAG TPA: hypothetical protein PLV32_10140 [Chitinophagaceae bacterium]|nr:hypothetical protein [Chitinophagaceae bacterium]